MGFLKKFFRGTLHEGGQVAPTQSSFETLSEEQLEAHLAIQRYGRFTLTDAIRPSYDLKVTPRQGYRHDFYIDEETKTKVPVLMAAANRLINSVRWPPCRKRLSTSRPSRSVPSRCSRFGGRSESASLVVIGSYGAITGAMMIKKMTSPVITHPGRMTYTEIRGSSTGRNSSSRPLRTQKMPALSMTIPCTTG